MESTRRSLKGTLETILVVDDDEAVLEMVVAILEHANFRVLSAHSGADCIAVANQTNGTIHMLLSDVDMPRMSGLDLSDVLRATRPGIRVMLMSGGDNGLLLLNYGWAYLQKPFIAENLLQMVTDVLHTPDRSQAGGREFDTREETVKRHKPENHPTDSFFRTTTESDQAPKAPLLDEEVSHLIRTHPVVNASAQLKKQKEIVNTKGFRK